jgi:putative CocE/NonD family hydrolase
MRKFLSHALCAALLLVCASTTEHPGHVARAQQQTAAPAAPQAAAPPRYKNYVEPRYKEATIRSLYLTMRDGVKIAVDVILPKDLPPDARLPTVMQMTRYRRSDEGAGVNDYYKFFTSHGYAVILMDVRGTGASTGTWPTPWSPDEIKDYGEVANWAATQTWSNGAVGAFGNSYSGTTAQLLAVPNQASVKAVVPRHYEFDVYTDVAFPGGILNEWLVKNWNEGNRTLDLTPGVKPVEADADKRMLAEALKAHAANIDVEKAARAITYRDDRLFGGISIDDFSVFNFRKEIERSRVPINNWGGWMDAGTADAVLRSFMTFSNSQRSVVGAWNHGASQNASPYVSPTSPAVLQRFEWLRFFDRHLKGIDTGAEAGKILYYYTMGEELWKTTDVWPVAGTTTKRLYFSEGNTLSDSAPVAEAGDDKYTVDFEATTGERNRWRTQLGGPVVYPDRADEDKRLLAYTSAPLAEDTEITGHPVVTLEVASTHTDGALFVYLEDVDAAGKVTYLTEGQLRVIHRRISRDAPPYKMFVPYHSFRKRDAQPLVPGEAAEIKFGLLPVSVLVRRGHRLRIAIAGHDKSVFARTPAEGTPVLTFFRNRKQQSFIELPLVQRKAGGPPAPVNLLTIIPPGASNAAPPAAANQSQGAARATTERKEVRLDAKLLDALTGVYQLPSASQTVTVTRGADGLVFELTGQPPIPAFAESETEFFFKVVDIQVSFVKDDKGQVTHLVVHQKGRNIEAKKIK